MVHKEKTGKGICPNCGKAVKFGIKGFGKNSPTCPHCGKIVLTWLDEDYNVHIQVAGGTGGGKHPRKYDRS